jgi:hypothetical protein
MKLTEEEWENYIDPVLLLEHVRKGSARKLRLYACACFRAIQGAPFRFSLSPEILQLVAVAERFADGAAKEEERGKAVRSASKWNDDPGSFKSAARKTLEKDGYKAAVSTVRSMVEEYEEIEDESGLDAVDRVVAINEVLSPNIREIFGNPFQPVKFNKKWRTSDVKALATGIYKDAVFDRMPILADALQDAGCDSDELLSHLREHPDAHVRGCWALDLVLGKE